MGYPSLTMKTLTIAAAVLVIAKAVPITDEIRLPAIGYEDTVLPLSRASVFIDRTTELPPSTWKADERLSFLDKVQELSAPDFYIPEVPAAVSERTSQTVRQVPTVTGYNIYQKDNETYVTTTESEPYNVSAVEYVSILENVKVGEPITKLDLTVPDAPTLHLEEVRLTTSPAAKTTSKEDRDDTSVPVIVVKPEQPDMPRLVLTLHDLHEAEYEKQAETKSQQAEEAPAFKPNYQNPAIFRGIEAFNDSNPRGYFQEMPVRDSIKIEVPSVVNNYFYNVFMSLLGASPYGRLQPMMPRGAMRPSRSVPVLLDFNSALAVNCTEHMKN